MAKRTISDLERFALGEIDGGCDVYRRFFHGINHKYDAFNDIALHNVLWDFIFRERGNMTLKVESNEWIHKGDNYPEGNCFDFIAQRLKMDIDKDYNDVFKITLAAAGKDASEIRQLYLITQISISERFKVDADSCF